MVSSKSNVERGANEIQSLKNRVFSLENWVNGVQGELDKLKKSKSNNWWNMGALKKKSKRKSTKRKSTKRKSKKSNKKRKSSRRTSRR